MEMKYRMAVSALALVVGGFAVTGCSGQENAGQGQQDTSASSTSESLDAFSVEGVVEKTTILDNDILSIEANELTYKNNTAYLDVTIANKADSRISASTGTVGFGANYVNGTMIGDGYMTSDIEPGESAEEEIRFDLVGLQLYGIKSIGEIGLGVRVSDADYDEVYKGIVSVETSLHGKTQDKAFGDAISDSALQKLVQYEIKKSSTDFSGMNWGGVSPVSAFLMTNKDGKHVVMMEVKNDSDRIASVGVRDISLDGSVLQEGGWSSDVVAPGKHAVIDIMVENAIDKDQTENFDLSNIGTVAFSVAINDIDGNTVAMPSEVSISF